LNFFFSLNISTRIPFSRNLLPGKWREQDLSVMGRLNTSAGAVKALHSDIPGLPEHKNNLVSPIEIQLRQFLSV
jgi:hypothetical protein